MVVLGKMKFLGHYLIHLGILLLSAGAPYSSQYCISSVVIGCMNSNACNYDAAATSDDGSCIVYYGCMDTLACNYDAAATCDDGSCLTAVWLYWIH